MIKARISLKHSVGGKKKSSLESELLHWIAAGETSFWVYFRFGNKTLCVPTTENNYWYEPNTVQVGFKGFESFPSGTVVSIIQE